MASLLLLPPSIRNVSIFASRAVPLLKLRFSTAKTTTDKRRTYAAAIKLLDSLQSNRATVSSISATPSDMNLNAIPEMLEWTRKAGYSPQDLAAPGLKYIHVAGTKGKGSVSVMIENILLQYWRERKPDQALLGRIGLYTSPHLIHVRERIRIDGSPISEQLFTRYFYELWDRLSLGPDGSVTHPKPNYFRYLTLLAFHTFIQEGVGTAIMECGIGGEYDSTNILPREALTACAITSLGIDHKSMLGETIEEIAWHKGGIMKAGVPAFSVKQLPATQAVLEKRATENEANLTMVERLPVLENAKLGLEGDFQRDNASLAVAVASSHLKALNVADISTSTTLPEEFTTGLETVSWPGRCQHIQDGNTEWMIDGAHTLESLTATATWFRSKCVSAMSSSKPPTATMLIFNQQDRDAEALLKHLLSTLNKGADGLSSQNIPLSPSGRAFTYAVFCTNRPFKVPEKKKEIADLSVQDQLAKVYPRFDRGNQLHETYASVEEAVELAHRVSKGDDERVLVLVTGSLHLAGAVLEVLEQKGQGAVKKDKVSSPKARKVKVQDGGEPDSQGKDG